MKRIWKYFLLIFSCIGTVNASVGYYIGCYKYHPADVTYYKMQWGFVEKTLLKNNNGRVCMELCRPYYQYGGTEGKFCHCLNSLIGREVDRKMCNTPCPNQHNSYHRVCGGKLKMSVYRVNLFADTMSAKTSNQISNQHVINIPATSSKDTEQNTVSEIAVTCTNYMTASYSTTEVSMSAAIIADITSMKTSIKISNQHITGIPATSSKVTDDEQNEVSEPAVTDTDYMTAPDVTTAVSPFSTQGSTSSITFTPSTATFKQSIRSEETNYTIIMTFAIGAFVFVSLFATVKLILFVRKRCSNTDSSIRDEDGQLYLRPVYVATQNDRLDGKPGTLDTHSDLYEEIELK